MNLVEVVSPAIDGKITAPIVLDSLIDHVITTELGDPIGAACQRWR